MQLGNKIKKEYFSIVNMTHKELLKWSKTELSKKGSTNKEPIRRNLRLIEKKELFWADKDLVHALKTINYLKCISKLRRSKKEIAMCYTKNELIMKNWGYDVKKK